MGILDKLVTENHAQFRGYDGGRLALDHAPVRGHRDSADAGQSLEFRDLRHLKIRFRLDVRAVQRPASDEDNGP